MATEALTRQKTTRDGAQVNLQSVTIADGFTFPNDGKTLLYVENTAGALTLTFTIQKTLDGQSTTRAEVVTASENWVLGPFPPAIYNDADGLVTVATTKDLPTAVAVIGIG